MPVVTGAGLLVMPRVYPQVESQPFRFGTRLRQAKRLQQKIC
jgi:hypothetical protein